MVEGGGMYSGRVAGQVACREGGHGSVYRAGSGIGSQGASTPARAGGMGGQHGCTWVWGPKHSGNGGT